MYKYDFMKKLIYTGGIIAIAVAATFSSCKKAETGPAGAKGDPGTANVIYSDWVDTNPWKASTTSTGNGKKTFYFDIPGSQLTQEQLDNSVVMVYGKFISDPDGEGSVKALPSIYYNLGGATVEYRFQYALSLAGIRVICDVIPNGSPSASNKVRYVIIPGGVAAGAVVKRDNSYEAVCARYNIPETGSNR